MVFGCSALLDFGSEEQAGILAGAWRFRCTLPRLAGGFYVVSFLRWCVVLWPDFCKKETEREGETERRKEKSICILLYIHPSLLCSWTDGAVMKRGMIDTTSPEIDDHTHIQGRLASMADIEFLVSTNQSEPFRSSSRLTHGSPSSYGRALVPRARGKEFIGPPGGQGMPGNGYHGYAGCASGGRARRPAFISCGMDLGRTGDRRAGIREQVQAKVLIRG
ncbi:hypothetical protein QBC35DRAFT_470780 [Podospora australis]|uniref:Uncharacterized protein n=1 Tax=Podospora australis TaxID=1536484 RepID=A0AAN7ALB3_9PEZI|nr:hypothetical protein QBC35DRAFT_470780 [Podospora australis]